MASSFPYEELVMRDSIILFILSTVGIIANLFAILASARLLRMQPLSPNVFVLGLSCADLVSITLMSVPSWLCYINGGWLGGKRLCDFQGFIFLFSTLCSAFMATLMAVDRYIAVTRPFFHRKTMTVEKAKVLLLAATATSFAVSFLPVFRFGSFVRNLSGSFCSVNWFPQTNSERAFCLFYAVLGGLPAVTVVFCNLTVILELFRSKKRRISVTNMIVPGARRIFPPKNADNSKEDTEKQFSRTMVVISVVYLSSWIPFMVRLVGNAFFDWRNSSADLLVCGLLLLNLIVDPFMYVLTRKQYRRVLRAMFACRCKAADRVVPFNQRNHPSISSASLFYSTDESHQRLKDLQEILHSSHLPSQPELNEREDSDRTCETSTLHNLTTD